MRLLFLLILLAGIIGGLIVPWAVPGGQGGEIGSFPLFDRQGGFRPAVVRLSADDGPIDILVEMTSRELDSAERADLITLTVMSAGQMLLEETLSFADQAPRQVSPQSPQRIYRERVGTLAPIGNGDHIFAAAAAGQETGDVESIDVILSSVPAIDPRIQPLGFALIAIGFIGFVLAVSRGRRPPPNPNSKPPPRWGRQPH